MADEFSLFKPMKLLVMSQQPTKETKSLQSEIVAVIVSENAWLKFVEIFFINKGKTKEIFHCTELF